MSGLLVNACSEEPDALIALVRVCGGAPRVTGGSTRKRPRKGSRQSEMFLRGQSAFTVLSIKGLR